MKKIIIKNYKIFFPLLFVLFTLLLSLPNVNAASAKKVDSQIIEKTIDGMETLNDLQKEYYKSALKNILTLDDLNRIIQRDRDYDTTVALKAGERGTDRTRETAEEAKKPGAKMIPIISDGVAWLEAAKAYNADPTNAKKDQVYSEKAFRFYNNFLPFGGIIFSMMADAIEDTRDRVEFEANQKKIMNQIIANYEARMEMEMRKRTALFDRIFTSYGVASAVFGEGQLEEPRWEMLRYFSDQKIENTAKFMQEYPRPEYGAYNTAAFLKMMKNGGPAKEAFLKNMKGGGPAGFAKHSPVYMTITDPFNHTYGVDPETKRLLCDNAAICSPLQKAGDAEYIIIPSIYNGVYQIQLVGYADGDYNFIFHGFNHDSELQGKIKIKGYIHQGEVLKANITITLNDRGYEVSEPTFVKVADNFPVPANPETLLPAIDKDPLEIYFEGEPCLISSTFLRSGQVVVTTETLYGVKLDYFICLKKSARPTYTFFTNKILAAQAINENNLQLIDEENKPIKGLIEVKGSTFSFTPNIPLWGNATIILKGGKGRICSKTEVCLSKDLKFPVSGLDPALPEEKEVPFELLADSPMIITKNVLITNTESVPKKDIVITTLSFKSFPPNIFFFVYNISSPVPYKITKGENDLIEFKIKELKAQETLNISLTYMGMLWGADYFSHLDVNKINVNYDPALLEKFTQPAAGIEVEDPIIKELAQKIVGEEKNPFWKAYKIYNWITANVQYDYEKEARIRQVVEDGKAERGENEENIETGALLTLQTKKGICDDYTKLFIALARAVGIPSRFVMLFVVEGKAEGHAFPEIYLPPYGWIPLDPTWGTNFASFARTEPGLFILAKEDGLTQNHLLHYSLESAETSGLRVTVSLTGGRLLISEEKHWDYLSTNRFFPDIAQLISLSEANEIFYSLKKYNKEIGQEIFTVAEKPPISVKVTVQRALEAHLNDKYLQVRAEVQKVLAEQLQAASTSLTLLAPKLQDYIQGPYSDDKSIILYNKIYRKGETNITNTEVLLQINQTKKDMILVQEQTKAGDYYAAYNSLMGSYASTFELYYLIINDMVNSEIQTTIYSIKNLLSFELGQMILIFVFMVIMPILWIWMSIHCLVRKKFRHLNKIVWFLIVFLICFPVPVGAIIYFLVEFIRKKPLDKDNVENNKIVAKNKKEVKK